MVYDTLYEIHIEKTEACANTSDLRRLTKRSKKDAVCNQLTEAGGGEGVGVTVILFSVNEVQDLYRLKPSAIPDICTSIQLKMRKRLIDLLWHLKRMKNCRIYSENCLK